MKPQWKELADKYSNEELIYMAATSVKQLRSEGYTKRAAGQLSEGDFRNFLAQALAERLEKSTSLVDPLNTQP